MRGIPVSVEDACGIHARPAGLLVKLVKGFASTATLEKGGKTCDLRKLMALMGMGVRRAIPSRWRATMAAAQSDPEIPERERLIACNVVMRSPRRKLRGLFVTGHKTCMNKEKLNDAGRYR